MICTLIYVLKYFYLMLQPQNISPTRRQNVRHPKLAWSTIGLGAVIINYKLACKRDRVCMWYLIFLLAFEKLCWGESIIYSLVSTNALLTMIFLSSLKKIIHNFILIIENWLSSHPKCGKCIQISCYELKLRSFKKKN